MLVVCIISIMINIVFIMICSITYPNLFRYIREYRMEIDYLRQLYELEGLRHERKIIIGGTHFGCTEYHRYKKDCNTNL